jgi:hypothetical protein
MNAADLQTAGAVLAAPAVVSAVVFLVLRRLLSVEVGARYAAAVAVAAGYCTGFALLQQGEALVPSRHWHWTFYLVPAAAIVGPVAAAVRSFERCLLVAVAAVVAAWLLVPGWASLDPPRSVWVPALAGYLWLLAVLIDPLPGRLPATGVVGLSALAAACVSALIAGFVSLVYAQPAGAAAAAIGGCWVASSFGARGAVLRGFGPVYATAVGGWGFVGCIEPQQGALYGLMVAAAAPLALWCCVWGPLARLTGFAAVAVRAGLVLGLLVAGVVGVMVAAGEGAGGEW